MLGHVKGPTITSSHLSAAVVGIVYLMLHVQRYTQLSLCVSSCYFSSHHHPAVVAAAAAAAAVAVAATAAAAAAAAIVKGSQTAMLINKLKGIKMSKQK